MMTGIVIGYNSTGSSTSRLRARTSIAANSVPTAANPSVPAEQQCREQQRRVEQRRLEQERDERHEHDLRRHDHREDRRAACRRRSRGDRPARASARAACRCSARARRCARAPASPRTQSRSRECPPRHRRPARPSFTSAKANTSTHESAKNSVVADDLAAADLDGQILAHDQPRDRGERAVTRRCSAAAPPPRSATGP